MPDFETEFDKYYAEALKVFNHHESIEELYTYIHTISDDDYRNSTFSKVASFLAQRGELDVALRFCVSIHRPLERADAFLDLAHVLAENHSLDAARNILRMAAESAEAIERCASDTAVILIQVADELEQFGNKTEALSFLHRAIELAKPKPQDLEKAKILRACARILAKWNLLPEAVEVAQIIESPQLRTAALDEIHGQGPWPVQPRSELNN